MTTPRLYLLSLTAMVAFAGNSLLCRLALKQTLIDAGSFTCLRILSGAAALWLVTALRGSRSQARGSWLSAIALFVYAAAFSFAYVSLSAGTGALLLFCAVQATMILVGLLRGERLRVWQVTGLLLALAGLFVLVFPGLSAPPLRSSFLMLTAGIAWGSYSLRGRESTDAINATASNFIRAVPLAVLLSAVLFRSARLDSAGALYAIASGALASGGGYVIWYMALPSLKAATAATIQLSVPLLAAFGGILLLGEPLSLRFLLSALAILGGIALVVLSGVRRAAAAGPAAR